MAEIKPRIQFTIDKSRCLGRGSFAAVYRAEFDTLPCAAKLLHPILFQGGDAGSNTIMERFQQECKFLFLARHPNIVQYLGICRDPDSEQPVPVLLMELMDESLTRFLEHSQQPLPYHLEVNLCHDITLALAYLHSHGIIHRDLSSNNILLIAGSRAKVGDFGMSRVLHARSQATPSTLCPGTQVYMPPESLRNPPTFTDKLDCFSFGVLEIQIMTRQFPNPGPAVQEIEDRRYRIGRVQTPIPDSERRRSHINLIDSSHPLLPTAISCLSYKEEERPSALDLCQLIAALKRTPRYTQSAQQVLQGSRLAPGPTAGIERQLSRVRIQENEQQAQQIRQLQQQLAVQNNQLEVLQREHEAHRVQHRQQLQQQLAARDKEIQTLQQRLDRRKEHQVQQQPELQQQLAAKDKEIQTLQQRIKRRNEYIAQQQRELQQQLADKNIELQRLQEHQAQQKHELQQQLATLERQNLSENQKLQQQIQTLQQQLVAQQQNAKQLKQAYVKEQRTTEVKERELQQLKKQLEASEQIVAQLEQANDQLTHAQVAAQAQARVPPQQEKTTQNIIWQKSNDAPEKMIRGSTTSQGELIYFNPMDSTAVHAYNSRSQQWSRLPNCPHTSSAMVNVDGRVTTVGGQQRGESTNAVLSLTEEGTGRNWIESFPPMPTKRFSLAAVCVGRDLVAAGGQCAMGGVLRTVEVLNVDSQQWSIASTLPQPCCRNSGAFWENRLYLLSGFNHDMNPVRSVLTCSIPDLLQSCQSPKNPAASEQPRVWCEIAPTPYFNSTCATVCGRLLAIGGYDATGKATKSIHVYSRSLKEWQATRDMPTARYSTLVATLLGDCLMVVGGWGEQRILWNKDPTKLATVEFCNFS